MDAWGYPYCRGVSWIRWKPIEGNMIQWPLFFGPTGAAFDGECRLSRSRRFGCPFFAHMEEIDFCWRLRSRGYGIVCVPSAVVYHVGEARCPRKTRIRPIWISGITFICFYKNLPDERLSTVMRCRFWTGQLAALNFCWKGSGGLFWLCFRRGPISESKREDFRAARKENPSRMVVNPVPEQARFSIFVGPTISKIVINTPICPIYSFVFAF